MQSKITQCFSVFFTKLRRKTASAFCTSIYDPLFRKRLAVWGSFFLFVQIFIFAAMLSKNCIVLSYMFIQAMNGGLHPVFLHNFHLIHCLLNVVQSCNFHFKKLYVWCLLLSSVRILRWYMSFLTSYMEGTLFSF